VKIGFGTCKDPSLIPKIVVVWIEGVCDAFEEHKLFILMLATRYFGSIIGMEVLWPLKDLSVDNVITIKFKQCCAITYGCNDLGEKRVLWLEKNLCKVFLENVDEVEDSRMCEMVFMIGD
jgi:hypothetical protein